MDNVKHITLRALPVENLSQKPVRTTGLVIVVAVLSLIFFASSLLTINLGAGLESMQRRMGADIMVVPPGATAQTEQILVNSCPQTFYFHDDILGDIEKVKGVSQITAQTFISSFAAGCCQAKLQIIGFDPDTDFVVQPWIEEQFHERVQDGHIIVGANVHPSSDGKVRLFRHRFPVDGQLARTGTSYDNTVFVNRETVRLMRDYSAGIGTKTIAEDEVNSAISSVLINVTDRSKPEKVAERINAIPGLENVEFIYSSGLSSKVRDSMASITGYVWAFLGLFWITGMVILFAVFSSSANERKKELASLRIMGATRKMLISMLIKEATLVGIGGGLIGVSLAALLMYPFSNYIRQLLKLPYLPAGVGVASSLALACLFVAVIVCVLAAGVASAKLLGSETYLTLREGD